MTATTNKIQANEANGARPLGRRAGRPSREEAENAVRTLIAWIGDDPKREGLQKTPRRVADSYKELFSGYDENAEAYLERFFTDMDGYQDMVMLRDIALESHCEHHMAPIIGRAHLAYMPDKRFVGLSKLARLVGVVAHRLQTQERMTAQIHDAIQRKLKPKGVAVLIEAKHHCMTLRGVHDPDVATVTVQTSGLFNENSRMEERFLRMARGDAAR